MDKTLTPKTVKNFNEILKLKRDNVSTRKSWMLINGINSITITNQVAGQAQTGSVTITKKEFERFIKFYETGK
jgi:hypothetical protein